MPADDMSVRPMNCDRRPAATPTARCRGTFGLPQPCSANLLRLVGLCSVSICATTTTTGPSWKIVRSVYQGADPIEAREHALRAGASAGLPGRLGLDHLAGVKRAPDTEPAPACVENAFARSAPPCRWWPRVEWNSDYAIVEPVSGLHAVASGIKSLISMFEAFARKDTTRMSW